MNAEGPQLHTHAIPKAVVKNADGSLTPGTGRWPQPDRGLPDLGDRSRTGNR